MHPLHLQYRLPLTVALLLVARSLELSAQSSAPTTRLLGGGLAVAVVAQDSQAVHKVVLDTDLGFASDDAMALLILLQSGAVDLLGVTVVTGNAWLDQEVANTLRLLEIAGRDEVPVHAGAEYPLVNSMEEMRLRESLYGETSEGGYKGAWKLDGPGREEVRPPDSRFAQKAVEPLSATEFLIRTVRDNPGEVVVIAIGPLTNIALAVSLDPEMARLARRLVVMGGGIGTRPEFNFWMDPEAARMVLRAPWPEIVVTPLNICRQAPFTREVAEAAARGGSPIARYFADTFIADHWAPVTSLMYDQIAVLSLLEPSVVQRSDTLWLDVEIDHGASYGATLYWDGSLEPPPGVRQVEVLFDLDYPRFIEHFVTLMTQP
ncbi:MAG: nucleoside hydrolase [Gemmatimonadota bacterium]|nr:MAG: nucleoside hydrolase [Gemmatimonadota bacterium]